LAAWRDEASLDEAPLGEALPGALQRDSGFKAANEVFGNYAARQCCRQIDVNAPNL
jgi:hypothetical protein